MNTYCCYFVFQFGRWTFLGVGVLYGAFHQNRLSKKEAKIREIETKEKAIKDVKLKQEKAIAAAGMTIFNFYSDSKYWF